jgi:hypothetical protein
MRFSGLLEVYLTILQYYRKYLKPILPIKPISIAQYLLALDSKLLCLFEKIIKPIHQIMKMGQNNDYKA